MHIVLIILSVLFVCGLALWLLFRFHPAFGPHALGHYHSERFHSPNYRDGQFRNEHPTPQFTGERSSGAAAMWRFLTDRTNQRVPKTPVPIVRTDIRQVVQSYRDSILSAGAGPANELFIWFGHSSYLFTLGGQTVLVDPVLRMEFPASLMMKPFPGTEYYTPEMMPEIDLMVITHEHWDHLDYATLRDLRCKVKQVVCPLGIADYLRYWGYAPDIITEMDWFDQSPFTNHQSPFTFHFSPFTSHQSSITCLPTRHFSNRLLGGANRTLWASFLLDGNGKKVYIGGDGGYDDRFRRIHDTYGEIDLAVMENGQYNTNWAYIHMLPEDLEQAMLDLQAKQYITVHHDKFSLAPHAWTEPDSVAQSIAARDRLTLLDRPIGTVIRW